MCGTIALGRETRRDSRGNNTCTTNFQLLSVQTVAHIESNRIPALDRTGRSSTLRYHRNDLPASRNVCLQRPAVTPPEPDSAGTQLVDPRLRRARRSFRQRSILQRRRIHRWPRGARLGTFPGRWQGISSFGEAARRAKLGGKGGAMVSNQQQELHEEGESQSRTADEKERDLREEPNTFTPDARRPSTSAGACVEVELDDARHNASANARAARGAPRYPERRP